MNLRKISTVAAAFIGCVFLWGCIFSTSSTPFIPHPAQLNPMDVFAGGAQRNYTWKESWTLGKKDSSPLPRILRIVYRGDTLVHDTLLHQIGFIATDGQSLPVSVVTSLGFNPSQLSFDTSAIREPGPGLGFPTLPETGWRTEQTAGDLRFVRTLKGFDTLRRAEGNVECWAFAESTYWDGAAVATATYSVGHTGLLRLYTQRMGFNPGGDTGTGVSWREVVAE